MRTEVLRVESLCKSFLGERILKNLTFRVFQNETLSILGADKDELNALIGILSGNSPQDSGSVFLKNARTDLSSPTTAKRSGVHVIFEQSYILDNLTIAENMFLGKEKQFFQSKKNNAKLARYYLNEVGLTNISPNTFVSELSPDQKALIEIAAAIAFRPPVLIFNKAYLFNSHLHSEILCKAFKKLNSVGTSVIYIAENPEYAKQLSDRIIFINNGVLSGAFEKSSFDCEKFHALLTFSYSQKTFSYYNDPGTPLLKVSNLSGIWVKNATFSISKGEILGVFNTDLQIKSEMLQLMYGMQQPEAGTIYLDGKEIKIKNTHSALKLGISYVPPPIVNEFVFSNMSYKENMTITALKRVSLHGFVKPYFEKYYSNELTKLINFHENNMDTKAKNINESTVRKLLITRAAATNPRILLLDEPFGGMDIYTRSDISKCLSTLAQKGTAIVIASKHLRELEKTCSKVIHLSR